MARSIRALAARAVGLYGDGQGARQLAFEIWVEDAYRTFVQETGGVYRQVMDTPLVLGQREFALPTDYREMLPNGVYLGYTARDISTISRSSNTVTVVTSTTHSLATGMTVAIDGVTPVGSTTFDGTFESITVTNTTTFTYSDTADDDSGSGGEVKAQSNRILLMQKAMADLDLLPEAEATEGQPQYYYFADPFTLGVEPVSDGSYPALFVEYDAGVPEGEQPETTAGLDLSAALPVPGFVEAGLIEYARARSTGVTLAEAEAVLKPVIYQWRSAAGERSTRNRR